MPDERLARRAPPRRLQRARPPGKGQAGRGRSVSGGIPVLQGETPALAPSHPEKIAFRVVFLARTLAFAPPQGKIRAGGGSAPPPEDSPCARWCSWR